MPVNLPEISDEEKSYMENEGRDVSRETSAQPKKPSRKTQTKTDGDDNEIVQQQKTESQESQDRQVQQGQKDTPEEQIKKLNASLIESRNAAKSEREQYLRDQAIANERLRQLQEAIEKSAKPQEQRQEIPDPDQDPLGALKYMMETVQKAQQQQVVTQQQNQQLTQQQRMEHAVKLEAGRLELNYIKELPDYDATINPQTGYPNGSKVYNDAGQFLANSRRTELMQMGIYSPEQVNDIMRAEALQLAQVAIQNGQNPAAIVMNLAKSRGFTEQKQQAQQTQQETEAEKIARIAKGQEAGFSLSQASGARTQQSGKDFTVKDLVSLPQDKFDAMLGKMSKKEQRAIFGE